MRYRPNVATRRQTVDISLATPNVATRRQTVDVFLATTNVATRRQTVDIFLATTTAWQPVAAIEPSDRPNGTSVFCPNGA